MEKKERMKKLIARLNEASMAYYQQAREIMSDIEYPAVGAGAEEHRVHRDLPHWGAD